MSKRSSTTSSFMNLSECLQQLRIQNLGRDVLFQIEERTFHADRAALMSKMKFFEKMFTIDMRDKNETVILLDSGIVQPEIFEKILNYATNSRIDLSKVDLQALYIAADFFNFKGLRRKIEVFMRMDMKAENVMFYKRLAIQFNLESLEEDCQKFIMRNLLSRVDRKQLISLLSYDELLDIIEELRKLAREEDMFYYAIDWIKDLEDERKCELFELMKKIPLEALSFTFLKEVVSEYDLIRNDEKCFELLFDAILEKPRLDSLYAMGEVDESSSTSISEYNIMTRKWTATTPMPSSRIRFGCAVIGHRLYVCGGSDGQQEMNELTVFDTLKWTKLTPMKHRRADCAASALNAQIYVVGGHDGTDYLAAVERYSVKTGQWSIVAPMITKRAGLELVSLKGLLYAIGGRNGNSGRSSVERYDPETDQWSSMSNTNNKYHSFGSAVLNGNIYIAGKSKCEVYSPADDKWTEMPAPSKTGPGRRLAVFNGRLYAIGEETKKGDDRKIAEVFDFPTRSWQPETDTLVASCFHSLAVVCN